MYAQDGRDGIGWMEETRQLDERPLKAILTLLLPFRLLRP